MYLQEQFIEEVRYHGTIFCLPFVGKDPVDDRSFLVTGNVSDDLLFFCCLLPPYLKQIHTYCHINILLRNSSLGTC